MEQSIAMNFLKLGFFVELGRNAVDISREIPVGKPSIKRQREEKKTRGELMGQTRNSQTSKFYKLQSLLKRERGREISKCGLFRKVFVFDMVADVNEKIMSGLIKMLFRLADTSVFLSTVAFSQTHLISDHHKHLPSFLGISFIQRPQIDQQFNKKMKKCAEHLPENTME